MPLLHQQLQDLGILISAGQISNLLTKGHDAFHAEKAAVKQAGLETARWISVDDTGARHLGINGVTTQIGDDRFTSFDTVASKSRLMFLMTLRGAVQDYVINPAALLYLHEQDAPETLINRLIEPDDRVFADEDVWTDHLIALGITGTKAVRLASEAAVAGSLDHHGLLQDAVIVSDGAGQFDVLRHGLCWIHAERPDPPPGHRDRGAARRRRPGAPPDLVVLPRPQALPDRSFNSRPGQPEDALRPPLHAHDRLCRARRTARPPQATQSRTAGHPRTPRGA